MHFGYAILYVKNVTESIDFYERAFSLKRKMIHEGMYGELDTGATRLAFVDEGAAHQLVSAPLSRAGLDQPAAPMEIALVTDDVEAAFRQALAAGALEVAPPQAKPWGQTVAYVRDLNGFMVELCTPLP